MSGKPVRPVCRPTCPEWRRKNDSGCRHKRNQRADEYDEDDESQQADAQTGNGQSAWYTEYADGGEDETQQPENPVKYRNPAQE